MWPENKLVREINGILRKNRSILKKLLADKQNTICSRDDLLLCGFRFGYYTQVKQVGQTSFYYCYEYGWLVSPTSITIIKEKTSRDERF